MSVDYPEVTAGIRWLDENRPGWAALINTRTLNISSSGSCVICQVSHIASYYRALEELGMSFKDGDDLGFDVPSGRTPNQQAEWYGHAHAQWRRSIEERLS